ncbi:MAG TPA: ROK family transcriptional regulator [Streptosporangiaceae bacterium]|nr:ROK family transcriptional regulator [Streptosporangiaceae bacterium]
MTWSATGGPPLLRQINSARVLAALRGAGAMRLADLAERSGLSRPTVGHVVDQLHEAGLVAYAGPGDAGPGDGGRPRSGRPPRLVRFRSEAAYVVGIDIGPHKARVAVADLLGRVVAMRRRAIPAAHGNRDLLAALRAAARDALAGAGVERGSVASVAAGTPGIVDPPRGTVTLAPGVPGWTIDLARELRRSFRCPVHVENDANLAALAERRHGAARDARTVVFILWGRRVGAGVLIGGHLHRGAANAAGEIGFLALDGAATAEPDTRGRGPFERMVGADAIAEAGRLAAERHGGALAGLLAPPPGRLTAEAVFTAAARGDTAAAEAVRAIAARFARGLAPVLLVLDPDLVVIGAGISRAGSVLLDAIGGSLRPLTLVPPRLELSALGDEAVALGAVELALADAERRLLPSPGPVPAAPSL